MGSNINYQSPPICDCCTFWGSGQGGQLCSCPTVWSNMTGDIHSGVIKHLRGETNHFVGRTEHKSVSETQKCQIAILNNPDRLPLTYEQVLQRAGSLRIALTCEFVIPKFGITQGQLDRACRVINNLSKPVGVSPSPQSLVERVSVLKMIAKKDKEYCAKGLQNIIREPSMDVLHQPGSKVDPKGACPRQTIHATRTSTNQRDDSGVQSYPLPVTQHSPYLEDKQSCDSWRVLEYLDDLYCVWKNARDLNLAKHPPIRTGKVETLMLSGQRNSPKSIYEAGCERVVTFSMPLPPFSCPFSNYSSITQLKLVATSYRRPHMSKIKKFGLITKTSHKMINIS